MTTSVDHREEGVVGEPADLRGVRTARILSFLIDYAIVLVLCVPFAIVLFFLGIITLGAAWALYAFLPLAVALVYLAKTMGGPNQATVGMRMMGVRIYKLDGGTVDPLLAGLHGLLFWVIHIVGFMLVLVVTFFSSKKRLLHDILLGTYVARG